MLKRNGPGDGQCPLCEVEEDKNHIFFTCVSAQFFTFFGAACGKFGAMGGAPQIAWMYIRVLPVQWPDPYVDVGELEDLDLNALGIRNKLVIEYIHIT